MCRRLDLSLWTKRDAGSGRQPLLMTRLPGRPEVNRIQSDAYLRQIASVLARIHQTRGRPGIPEVIGAQPSHIWAAPQRRPRSELLYRAQLKVEETGAKRTTPVVIHGDFYSGNLLWYRGRLSGVVDWMSIGYGPRAYDVANCRCDLALLSGWRTADRLLSLYEADVGEPIEELALWDLYCGVSSLENFRHWLVPFREQGLVSVSARQMRSRLLAFVARALAAWQPRERT
jgi:aminoglycoside phosphotransferase (APT) family kinase protein